MAWLDGTLPENSATKSLTDADIHLMPGNYIAFQWVVPTPTAGNQSTRRYGLAIDDLSISYTVIPEPSSTLLMLGSAGLFILGFRRRLRKRESELTGVNEARK